MRKKYFINDGSQTFSVISNHVPDNPDYLNIVEIPDALLGEDDRWLQIEQIDVDGSLVDTVTVNETLKTTIQQQDLNDDLAKEAEKQAKEDEKNALKDKADKTKNRKIDTLDEIKDELQNIYDVLDYIMKNI